MPRSTSALPHASTDGWSTASPIGSSRSTHHWSPAPFSPANGRNPIPVVVPCHRVIGANGSLTGYAGGLERKQVLLDLEVEGLF